MKIYIFQVLSSNTKQREFMYILKLVIFILLFLGTSLHAKNASLDKVKLQLQWKHQFEFAGFYAAKEKGFYEDVGLDVEFIEYDNNQNISDQVINGEAHYGLTYGSLVADYLNGKPVVLIANFFKQSPLVLIAQENIKTVNQLKGKKVMGSLDEITNLTLRIMLEKFNVSIDDINNIPHTFNIEDFVNKNVDAMIAFTTNELYELNKRGIKYTILDPTVYGTKYYDINLFTTTKEVQENPLRVQKFREASIKGWEYTLNHQDEIIELILKKYNTQNKTKEALAFEAKQIEQIMLPKVYPIGSIDKFRIKTMADSFIQSGFVENVKDSKNKDLNKFIFQDIDNSLNLTQKEKAYIKNHPIITAGNDKNWPPFDFYENGQAKGFSVDYIKEIGRLTGLQFKFIQDKNWELLIKKLKNKEIDILTALETTEKNKKFALFSDDILMTLESMVIKEGYPAPDSYKDLYGKRVGVIKGYDLEDEIRKNHTLIDMVLFDTPLEALRALSDNKIDVLLENSAVSLYLINKHFLTNLKLSSSPKFPNIDNGDKINISSRIDHPQLHSIIQKAIKAMPDKTIKNLHDKWMSEIKNSSKKNKIVLTKDEQSYLKKKKVITMCVDPNWMPFEKIEEGKHIGLASDYIELISKKIHMPISLIETDSWSESLEKATNRECDILSMVARTDEKEKYLDFTSAYIETPLVIATKHDQLFIDDLNSYMDKKWAVVKGYSVITILKNKFPNINIVEVYSISDGLKQVENGTLFGYIGNSATISHAIQKEFFGTISITGRLEDKVNFSIATRNDEQILHDIFEKAVLSIDPNIRQHLLNKWISVKHKHGYDYILFWKILTPFLLLALMLGISQYILRQYNKKLKNEVAQKVEELRQKDAMLLKKYRMAAMGEMLSMIAHQWRQPLGAISSAVMGIEVKIASGKFDLNDQNDREKFLAFLERKHHSINDYVQFLSTTTDDFRNFFNPDKSRDSVSLTVPIENALNIVQTTMQNNGIEIIKEYQVDESLPLYKNEIMQVMLNLLKNSEDNFLAKKISDPKITIATQSDGNTFIISICDNGKGIPEDIIDKIFDPYFSTKDEKNGTGLGLYMSKIMIEDHHKGILNVRNSEDGVCFEIIFKKQIIE